MISRESLFPELGSKVSVSAEPETESHSGLLLPIEITDKAKKSLVSLEIELGWLTKCLKLSETDERIAVANLPEKIIVTEITAEQSDFLKHLASNGFAKQILAKTEFNRKQEGQSQVMRLIDFDKITHQAGELLVILLDNVSPENLAGYLPEKIDLSKLSYGGRKILEFLFKKNLKPEILEKLPKDLANTAINYDSSNFIARIFSQLSEREIVYFFPTKINLLKLNLFWIEIIRVMCQRCTIETLASYVPEEINLENLDDGGLLLVSFLTNKLSTQWLKKRLPAHFDLTKMSEAARSIFNDLADQNSLVDVLSKLPVEIPINNLSRGSIPLLEAEITRVGIEAFWLRIKKPLELKTLSMASASFLNSLVDAYGRDFEFKILEILPAEITFDGFQTDSSCNLLSKFTFSVESTKKLLKYFKPGIQITNLNNSELGLFGRILSLDFGTELMSLLDKTLDLSLFTNDQQKYFCSGLIKFGFASQLVEMLPEKIDYYALSDEASWFLIELISHSDVRSFSKFIPKDLDWPLVTDGAKLFLRDLAQSELADQFLDLIPAAIDLEKISDNQAKFLIMAGNGKLLQAILDRISQDSNLDNLSEGGLSLLVRLGYRIEAKKLLRDILSKNSGMIRKNLSPDELPELTTQVGPYLHELIENFPLVPDSVVLLGGGWAKAQINKETDSSTFVYFNLSHDFPRIFFRNFGIKPKAIEVYQQAAGLLPDYVAGIAYPELSNLDSAQIMNYKTYKQGFREVYAGVDVETLLKFPVPAEIKANIHRQVNYILLNLSLNNIEHGHPHPGNFNVRFLLISKTGEKQVCFDLNYAIQVAKQQQLSLTPIVVLRDWDQGSSKS